MVQTYRFHDDIVRADDPEFARFVGLAHSKGFNPYCMCSGDETGLKVYVAKRHDKFIVHRMPDTGPLHDADCVHFEPADDLTGLGALRGQAIIDDEESGQTLLKLGFPLKRGASRTVDVEMSDEAKPSVSTEGSKLGLRGFLHYVWNEAALTHWHPKMLNKRNWTVVRRELLRAVESKVTKGNHLATLVFVPEFFKLEDKFAIAARRREATIHASPNTKRLMIVIAEVKSFEAAVYGDKIICRHLPDWHLFMDESLSAKVKRNFENEIEAWQRGGGHLIVCATFELSKSNFANVREITFMTVTEQWLPFEGADERALVDEAVFRHRHFTKGLRMNLGNSVPIAQLILTDTKPRPTAIYLRNDHMSDDNKAILAVRMSYEGVEHHVTAPGERLPLSGYQGKPDDRPVIAEFPKQAEAKAPDRVEPDDEASDVNLCPDLRKML